LIDYSAAFCDSRRLVDSSVEWYIIAGVCRSSGYESHELRFQTFHQQPGLDVAIRKFLAEPMIADVVIREAA
jgi:hypothetical protein